MLLAAYLMILAGAGALAAHLALIRPARTFGRRGRQAHGLVAVFLLWYVRALVLLISSGGTDYTGQVTAGMVFRLVSGFLIDALIVDQVVSFLRFRRAYRLRAAEIDAQPSMSSRSDS